jgi:hypothetical protein
VTCGNVALSRAEQGDEQDIRGVLGRTGGRTARGFRRTEGPTGGRTGGGHPLDVSTPCPGGCPSGCPPGLPRSVARSGPGFDPVPGRAGGHVPVVRTGLGPGLNRPRTGSLSAAEDQSTVSGGFLLLRQGHQLVPLHAGPACPQDPGRTGAGLHNAHGRSADQTHITHCACGEHRRTGSRLGNLGHVDSQPVVHSPGPCRRPRGLLVSLITVYRGVLRSRGVLRIPSVEGWILTGLGPCGARWLP